MKKSIYIIVLCFVQGACASTEPVTGSHQIAAEISVRYELLEASGDVATVTAQNDIAAN